MSYVEERSPKMVYSKKTKSSDNKRPNRTVETDKYLFCYSKSKFSNHNEPYGSKKK